MGDHLRIMKESDVTESSPSWSEDDSELYRELAPVAVPRRAEQIAALLMLLPTSRRGETAHRLVELGCGAGALSHALLEAYPDAHLTALDGSPSMLARSARRLSKFGSRVQLETFALASPDWLPHLDEADAVLASLCVHHLDHAQKRALFRAIGARLSESGALLLADLVEPQRPEAAVLSRDGWDLSARRRADAIGRPELWSRFEREKWNVYRYPDPSDRPSPLFRQLQWLAESGFSAVDCFWMYAGHAVYGGYRGAASSNGSDADLPDAPSPLGYAEALDIARRAIAATR